MELNKVGSRLYVLEIQKLSEDIAILSEKYQKQHIKFELTNQQHLILTLLIRYDHLSPNELAKKMDISKSAISQLLAKLEYDGFIIRKKDEIDKRLINIRLSNNGLIYKEQMLVYNKELSEKYYSYFSESELDTIIKLLEKTKGIYEENLIF